MSRIFCTWIYNAQCVSTLNTDATQINPTAAEADLALEVNSELMKLPIEGEWEWTRGHANNDSFQSYINDRADMLEEEEWNSVMDRSPSQRAPFIATLNSGRVEI